MMKNCLFSTGCVYLAHICFLMLFDFVYTVSDILTHPYSLNLELIFTQYNISLITRM